MKTQTKTLLTAFALIGSATLATSTDAAVVVEQYTHIGNSNSDASFSFDTVSASDSVLLVAIGSELQSVQSVSFNGVTASTPLTFGDTTRESFIFAIDLGNEDATSGLSIAVDTTPGGTSGFSVWALQVSNADFSTLAGLSNTTGGSSNSAGSDTSITVPTLAAGSLILDVVGNQNANDPTSTGLTRTTLQDAVEASSQISRSSLISGTTGGGDIGYSSLNGSASMSAVWIEAVPEPGSLALLGLGGLCVLRRRH